MITFTAMGTMVSLAGEIPDGTLGQITDAFEDLEQRFSLYRDDSEISRLARHEFPLTRGSAELRDAYALAQTWRADTEGAFSPHRPDVVIDLSGVVKAMAIARAGELLGEAAVEDWAVNAGGDVLAGGAVGHPWPTVGIVDPTDRTALLSQFTLSATHPALATSGIAERGEHVWRIGAWDAEADPFVQVSVAGPDIMTADVLATAVLSGGRPTLDLAVRRWAVEVLAVTRSGRFFVTSAFRAAA